MPPLILASSKMAAERVDVVIVVWQQTDDELRRIARRIESFEGPVGRIWMVNNNVGRARPSDLPETDWVDSGANVGWTGGANLGMRLALEDGCSHVLFLNTDVRIVDDQLVVKLLDGFHRVSDCGLISPGITLWPDTGRIWYRGGSCRRPFWVPHHPGINRPWKGPARGLVPTRCIVGCCVMSSRACLEATKGFDERLFMYLDDPDLSLSARAKGFGTYLLDEPLVAHEKPGRRLGAVEAYYFGRNPLLLAAKYERTWGRLVALVAQLAAMPVYQLRALDRHARMRYLVGLASGMRRLMAGAPPA